MTTIDPRVLEFKQRIASLYSEMPLRSSRLHAALLDHRSQSLRQIAHLFALQVQAAQPGVNSQHQKPVPLFDTEALVEFGTGSLARCLGPEYTVFEGRRTPRIPNGDLLLMSRVINVEGNRFEFKKPSAIIVEYDIPSDAWYLLDNAYPFIPYSVLMEIALQPCGFLSAYMGTALQHPNEEFFFRNLDGQSRLLRKVDARGQTITAHAHLLSTVQGSGTIIQKFTFQLSLPDGPFFEGESVFGFFSPETMANQVGLDSGKAALPWLEQPGTEKQPRIPLSLVSDRRLFEKRLARSSARLSQSHLDLLSDVVVIPNGGRYEQGYVYAQKPINHKDWFYNCHFYQDPVMPGSLGVEAVYQALQAFVLTQKLDAPFANPHFDLPPDILFSWKYRGQITPNNHLLRLEAHIEKIETTSAGLTLFADASLWADSVRIYELKHITLNLSQG